jgi:acetoin utilization deacetylase AcuC-like enzyme
MPAPSAPPKTLKVLYSEDLVADAEVPLSPSDRKPRPIAEALLASGWPIEIVAPHPVSIADLCRAHDPDYVIDVLTHQRSNGFGNRSKSLARSLPYTCGALYDAAVAALGAGISASLTSGFHHAGPRAPRGYCTFNGLVVAALRLLEEGRAERIAIVDGDYHFGDGTQAILDLHPRSSQILHISFGATLRRPEQAETYLDAIAGLEAEFVRFRPDLVIYQAGVDVHVDDRLGGLLTTEQMRQRDRLLFSICRRLEIPVTWNLAGGYQIEADGSMPKLVALHLDTFEQALRVWGLLSEAAPA